MRRLILHGHENIAYKFINWNKGNRDMKKNASCSWVLSHDYITRLIFWKRRRLGLRRNVHARHAWWKKIEREREIMLGMLVNQAWGLSCLAWKWTKYHPRKERKNSANHFLFKESPLALGKKKYKKHFIWQSFCPIQNLICNDRYTNW